MKIKRQKQAKKTISFYKYNFSFREPFQILIDGTFCQAALKNKIQIKEQMPKYLMGEVQLCTTRWVHSPLSTPLLPTHYPRSLLAQHRHHTPFNNMSTSSRSAVRWRSSRRLENSCTGPRSSCRGFRSGSVRISRSRSQHQSVCCPCWKRPTRTTTSLPHR